MEWSNWSGNVRATPVRVESPTTEADVVALVRRAAADGLAVRPAGTRHSFTPLCATDGVAVDLHALAGVESVDRHARTATVLGGSRLADVGAPLREAGLSLHNQGDVDTQTITGAIGTGTHGTGPTLGNLSTAVVGVRIVTADGELHTCTATQKPDLYEAARLSLGAVGIVTAVTMAGLDAYNLHERIWFETADVALPQLDHRIAATRHYEFWWHPPRDLIENKSLDPTTDERDALPDRKRERIDHSHVVFPTARELRFNEMEYAIPSEHGPACFTEIRTLIQDHYPALQWPIEYRTLAADDVWISPAYQRPTVTISVHEDAARPYKPLFAECEVIFRAHDGRPHWGKVHDQRAEELAARYPKWEQFSATRAAVDPDGRFLNPYLRDLLGA